MNNDKKKRKKRGRKERKREVVDMLNIVEIGLHGESGDK
jgi:hypothetical protein